jgi:hypothetical protein
MATDPPDLPRFLAGEVVAVAASGLFAAAFILALQSVLLSLFGERLFRRVSLAIQGITVTVLVVLMLLFPILSGVTPALLQSGSSAVRWFPPFWFLGMDQRILEGPSALPIYGLLARIGAIAILVVPLIAVAAYPLAYLRRVRRLVEGASTRSMRNPVEIPFHGLLHATVIRPPVRRAVFHFIGQTLLRVPRYRIHLVLYGGVGLSVLIATVLRLSMTEGHLHAEASADGIRVAIGIITFWVIAGLRTAFVSSGNQLGNWVLRLVHGCPPPFGAAIEQLSAAKVWVMLCSTTVTGIAIALLRMVSPAELLTWPATLAQWMVAIGFCVLLTDIFFLNVTVVPFTGGTRQQPNLAFTVLRYFSAFPLVMMLSAVSQYWIAINARHFGIAAILIVEAHLWLRRRHRNAVRLHCEQLELEEDEEEFPMRLGLRY